MIGYVQVIEELPNGDLSLTSWNIGNPKELATYFRSNLGAPFAEVIAPAQSRDEVAEVVGRNTIIVETSEGGSS